MGYGCPMNHGRPWEIPGLARLLAPLGVLYGWAAGCRRWLMASRGHRFPVPVISVGNLTVGGTGKTPFVSHLLSRLPGELSPPLVLSRGYGATRRGDRAPLNDEGEMLARRHPGLAQAQGANRIAAARAAWEGADPRCVILDDGAQHVAIRRDLEILLLDAPSLLHPPRVLPAGPWREPLHSVRRADLIVLTKLQDVDELEAERAATRLEKVAADVPILRARDEARFWIEDGERRSPGALSGCRVGLVAGIARPDSFRRTVERLGAEVVWLNTPGDHRRLSAQGMRDVRRRAADVDRILVTEKDAARISDQLEGLTWGYIEMSLRLEDETGHIDRVLADLAKETAR